MTSRAVVERSVPARVGLVGNPSDGHGGAVLATVVPGLVATVSAERSAGVSFLGGDQHAHWPSVEVWRRHVRANGHGDAQRIVSAAVWTLDEHLAPTARGRGVALRWSTQIPRSLGLAGSSALAVAAIDAAAEVWGVELDRRVVAALALTAERDVLGIAAGWQDRVVQSFGTTVLVDTAVLDQVDGLAVPLVAVPAVGEASMPLLVGWSHDLTSPSGDYHGHLQRIRADLAGPMGDLAALARGAMAALERCELLAVAAAMDAGWLIRQAYAPLHPDHAALVEMVRAEGVPATTPGSGGSVVAMCLDDEARRRAISALEHAGCAWTTLV